MHVVDGDTGNELSGITITDTTTLETHASACSGVVFADAPGDNFTTDAGTGTDCVTTSGHFYDATTDPAQPAGDITIQAFQDLFFQDEFVGTNGVVLSAHTPDLGGPWSVEAGAPEIQLTGSHAATMPSTGDTRYSAAATPPSADYKVILQIRGDTGYSDQTYAIGRQNGPADTYYYALADLAGVLKLGKVVAGVDTVLATGTFTMPPLSSPAQSLTLDCVGTTIRALFTGATTLSVTDNSITAAGKLGIRQTRAVGQPVHITEALAL